MILREELYFEIVIEGLPTELKYIERFLLSGEFDDFFEITEDYISYENEERDDETCRLVFTNDDNGIEIRRFDPEDFLDILCPAASELNVSGTFYDVEDEEFRFISLCGDSGYTDVYNIDRFNDELSEQARIESGESDGDEDY